MSEFDEFNDDVVDDDDDVIEVSRPEEDKFDKVVNWVKENKVKAALAGVGAFLGSMFLGAKAFSKTKTVEVEKLPDPTIMDKYDRIPVDETTYTNYKYVLKDEYNDKV